MSTVQYKRRKYNYKRKRPANPPSRWSTYGAAGWQLAKDVMYLKTLINSEPHNHYVDSSNNFNWAGTVVSLSAVPVGDTGEDRTGNRVLPRFAHLRMHVQNAEQQNYVRVMLFRYWGDATSAVPVVTPAEVLRTVGTQFAPLSMLNEDNTGPRGDRARRIEVLKNVLLNLDSTQASSAVLDWDVEMNGMQVDKKEHMEWADAVGQPTDPISGGLYLLFISNSATNCAYQVASKLVFYDN